MNPRYALKSQLHQVARAALSFEFPSKRRMSDSEIAELDFRECKFNMLLRISSIWINAGSFGCTASPEAIMAKKLNEFPEALAFESAEEDLGNF